MFNLLYNILYIYNNYDNTNIVYNNLTEGTSFICFAINNIRIIRALSFTVNGRVSHSYTLIPFLYNSLNWLN